jgi:hypothetical protein
MVEVKRCPIPRVVSVLITVGVLAFPACAKYGGGSGTAEAPYLIATAADLIALSESPEDYGEHFRLTADIDMNDLPSADWLGIGGGGMAFRGTFDGGGHRILHLTCIRPEGQDIGLFGQVRGLDAAIRDLHLVAPHIDAGSGSYVGTLVGRLSSGTVTGCSIDDAHVTGDTFVGGLAGWSGGTVSQCSFDGVIDGRYTAGGLVGITGPGAEIRDCRAEARVSGVTRVGGLVGAGWLAQIHQCATGGATDGQADIGGLVGASEGAIMCNCYSTTSVSGGSRVGGLVGQNARSCACSGGSEPSEIHKCYAAGPVFGEIDTGGLAGLNGESCVVERSFWDLEATGLASSDGGTGLTTAQMQSIATYLEAGWDFTGETVNRTDDLWWILEGRDYPHLWSEGPWELVVDDFESYDDDANAIFGTWIDGWDVSANGSVVGCLWPITPCPRIMHEGRQSMPYDYNNAGPANYSEATARIADLAVTHDWTHSGAETLSLWFYGDPANDPELMYVALANPDGPSATIHHTDPNATRVSVWTEWKIPLTEFSNQGVALTDIDAISIGFGDKDNPQPGGSGTMYFDDIRLHRPQPTTP